MKQIYNFEKSVPPYLTEAILQKKLEQKKENRQTIILFLAGFLMELCYLLTAIIVSDTYPIFSFILLAVFVISITGSSVLVLFFIQNRRIAL